MKKKCTIYELDTEPIEMLMGEATEKLKKLLAYRPTLDEDEINRLRDEHAEMIRVLNECRLQFEYLQDNFTPTGTTNAVLYRVKTLLNRINTNQ